MSEKVKDGGPAFPRPSTALTDGAQIQWGADGMTLRDYFAAKAPNPPEWWINAAAHEGRNPRKSDGEFSIADHAKARAEWAFRYADAMIAAREPTP